jgi:tetratricopeptide (TPR) repeat protein
LAAEGSEMEMYTRLGQSRIAFREKQLDLSQESAERALELAKLLGSRLGQAASLISLANAVGTRVGFEEENTSLSGDYTPARKYVVTARDIYTSLGYEGRNGLATALNNEANMHLTLSNPEHALDLFLRSQQLYQVTGDVLAESMSLENIANTKHKLGDYEDSRAYHVLALQLAERIGNYPQIAITSIGIASCLVMEKRYVEAATIWFAAQKYIREISMPLDLEDASLSADVERYIVIRVSPSRLIECKKGGEALDILKLAEVAVSCK